MENRPLAGALVSPKNSTGLECSSPPNGNVTTIISSSSIGNALSVLQDTATRERAWLKLVFRLAIFIFKYPPLHRVLDTVPPITTELAIHFRSDVDKMLECVLTISRYVGALPWRSVAEALLDLSVRAAEADRWEYEEKASVLSHGVEVIGISFKIRPPQNYEGRVSLKDGVVMTQVS